VSYRLRVNGEDHDVVDGWIGESLLYVLRERLGLAGSKNACEQGECGSCSVRLDGELVCACLVLGAAAAGRDLVTIEAIGASGSLSDVQRAFVEAGAVQCGFCTPGLVMAIHHLLDETPAADLSEVPELSEVMVREAISGNLCRCTGYGRILDAVARTLAERRSTETRGSG